MSQLHASEARASTLRWATNVLAATDGLELVLVWDPSSRLRIVGRRADGKLEQATLDQWSRELASDLGVFWSGDILDARRGSGADRKMLNEVLEDASPVEGAERLGAIERRRSKEEWFSPSTPPWLLVDGEPAIVTFISLKGGYGRSTALAAVARILSSRGWPTAALDLDLEAPGLAEILRPTLPTRSENLAAAVDIGIIDYLLERALGGDVSIADYGYPGGPNLGVYPAGVVDEIFLEKLSRLDYEALALPGSSTGALAEMLLDLRGSSKRPAIALMDARAGLHEITAAAANGTSHLVVLFGRDRPESWQGVRQVVRQLGRARIEAGESQQPILLVFAQAPGVVTETATREPALARFKERAYDIFQAEYYADVEDEEVMGPRAADDEDAPHYPVALGFDELILHASEVEAMLPRLEGPDFVELADTVLVRLGMDERQP